MPSHELNLVHETSVDPCQVGCGMVLGMAGNVYFHIDEWKFVLGT